MHNVKNMKRNMILIFFVTAIVLFFVLKDEFNQIVGEFAKVDIKYILIAVFFFFLSMFIRGYVNYKSVNNKKKISLMESFKHIVIVQFFNNVTPFSLGGQPMEIYMIQKHNIKTADATNITIQNFIFYQLGLVIFGLIAVSYNYIYGVFPPGSLLKKLVLLGFIFNTFVVFMLFFIMLSKKFTDKVMHIIVFLCTKIRIVKNKEKTIDKWKIKLEEFHNGAKELRKRKALFVYGALLNVVSLGCLYLVPLFVMFSLGNFTDVNVMETLTASAYIMIIASSIPIPGGTGGAEFGYLYFFGSFVKGPVLTTSLLIWRFITYYLGILVGGIALNFDKKGEGQ